MKSLRFFVAIISVALLFSACEKNDHGIGEQQSTMNERIIVYSVDNIESRVTLETEEQWDTLLDQLCNQAQSACEIAFFNMNTTTHFISKSTYRTKETHTITTDSREEIKAWMKEMEIEGLTVTITYDRNTGKWNGTARSTATVLNISNDIVGTWHFSCMVVTQTDLDGHLLNCDLYVPEDNGGTMYYTFHDNGTLTLTITGNNGVTATENGTWTLSSDGILSSNLLPNGLSWNVNWITSTTLIISCADLGSEDGDFYYQIQFDDVTE